MKIDERRGIHFPGKLTEDQQLEVCRQLASFHTPDEIRTSLKHVYGITVKRENIYKYSNGKKWKPFIAAARAEWVKGMVEVPLFHKRTRVEALVKLIERCEKDPKIGDRTKRDEVARRLRQIQEEVDEKHTFFTNITANQYITMSEADLLQRRDTLIERLKHYGGTNGQGTDGIRARPDCGTGRQGVDWNHRSSGEGDRTDGGHDCGPEAGSESGHGGQGGVPGELQSGGAGEGQV